MVFGKAFHAVFDRLLHAPILWRRGRLGENVDRDSEIRLINTKIRARNCATGSFGNVALDCSSNRAHSFISLWKTYPRV